MDATTMTGAHSMKRAKSGELTWADLVAKDLEKQTAFYEALFGWTHNDIPTGPGQPPYRFFMRDGLMVAGGSQMNSEYEQTGLPSMWNVYFVADDVDEKARMAVELGGTVAMPAMTVMDQGRMVGIQDPSGATFFFWQPLAHSGSEVFGEPGTVSWADLSTYDPEKVAPFYEKLAGWEIERMQSSGMPYWMATIDGQGESGLMPMAPNAPADMPPNWLLYFGSADVSATTDKAISLGAKALMDAPMDVGTVVFNILQDPAGAVFAVMTPPKDM
jgi:uncharacterized protein